MNDKPLPCHLDPDYLYDAKVEARLEREHMTPEQQAQEYATLKYMSSDGTEKSGGVDPVKMKAYLAGYQAAVKDERERIWAEAGGEVLHIAVQLTQGELKTIIFGEAK